MQMVSSSMRWMRMTRKIALSVLCLLLTVLALFSGWKIYSELSARQRE